MNLQEAYYQPGFDYRKGGPHLKRGKLHDRLADLLTKAIRQVSDQGLPLRVLEIGAGHGGFTERALALGCEVTAVDMSAPAVQELQRRFGTNPRLEAAHDPDGTLPDVGGEYSVLLFASVLHHIPEYVPFLRKASERLAPGGTLLTFQDPLLYARHQVAHRAGQAAYLTWRLGQGGPVTGLQTRLRRLTRTLDETNPADMVEYHIVRDGVDEDAILSFASEQFAHVELISYWSSQLSLAQRAGDRLGLQNSFGVIAHGYGAGRSRTAMMGTWGNCESP